MIIAAILYLRLRHSQTSFETTLYYKKSRLNVVITKHCTGLAEKFSPTFWATNCHVQTLLHWLWPQKELDFKREYLQMADQGVIALDWAGGLEQASLCKTSPILLLVPDLSQSTPELSDICEEALARKFRPVVFARRGHSDTPLTTRRLQGFGETGDLEEAMRFLHHSYPHADIAAMGFSAGSGLLLSYLGEVGQASLVSSAVCVSPYYDAEELFRQDKFPQPYNWLLTQKLKTILARHPCLDHVIAFDAAMESESVRQIDERVYVQLNKFSSLEGYWKDNNPMRSVGGISIPVLCINALDDPICPKDKIPFSLFKNSSNLLLVATEKGGHCGFFESPFPESWANKLACDYLYSVLYHALPNAQEETRVKFIENGTRNRSYTTWPRCVKCLTTRTFPASYYYLLKGPERGKFWLATRPWNSDTRATKWRQAIGIFSKFRRHGNLPK